MSQKNEANKQELRPRPLSPHLGIYKLPLTAVLSIGHRISGVGLYIGLSFFSWWFIGCAFSKFEACYIDMLDHPFVKVMIFLVVYGFVYHLCTGVRHLFWDIGCGFEINRVKMTDIIVLLSSVVITALFWYLII